MKMRGGPNGMPLPLPPALIKGPSSPHWPLRPPLAHAHSTGQLTTAEGP